jgi:hypothetical protein
MVKYMDIFPRIFKGSMVLRLPSARERCPLQTSALIGVGKVRPPPPLGCSPVGGGLNWVDPPVVWALYA